MTLFLIIFLSAFLVLDCVVLVFLVLMQLPKKEAGIGMAFGGGAADALFGAGSGTALSQLTKWTATIFFVLVFLLSIMNNHAHRSAGSELNRALQKQSAAPATTPQSSAPATATPASNAAPAIQLTIPSNAPTTTPAPAAPANANSNNAAQPK